MIHPSRALETSPQVVKVEKALSTCAFASDSDALSRVDSRVAARWLLRYLEECNDATIDEAATVAARRAALGGDGDGARR
jgi:hypothetical protein